MRQSIKTAKMNAQRGMAAVIWILVSLQAVAGDLVGEGYGSSPEDARRKAMAALSESLSVEVQSEFRSSETSTGASQASRDIRTVSRLPLLGVETEDTQVRGNQHYARAVLKREKVLPLYRKEVEVLAKRITHVRKKVAGASSASVRYQLLSSSLTAIEQYNKIASVIRLLGGTGISSPGLTRADVRGQLNQIEQLTPTLELAVKVLARDLPAGAVYVFPATPSGSHEVTALGRVLRDKLAAQVKGSDSPDNASLILRGQYEPVKDKIHVTYRMLDAQGNTVAVRTVALGPNAYKGIDFQPRVTSFDKLLHQGVVVNNDFRISLATNRGSEDLMFVDGDELELLVKLNRSGYFYAVSHVNNSKGSESYLLEVSDERGPRRFVRYIGPDDANRWISLGTFTVGPPYGVESLQVIASSDDLASRLPPYQLDKAAELYRLQAVDASDGLLKTRGLRPKSSRTRKTESAETVLMMTIMPK